MATELKQLAVLYCDRCGRMVLQDELTDGGYRDTDAPITCRACARDLAAGRPAKRTTPKTGGSKRVSSRRLKTKGSGTQRGSRSISDRRGSSQKGLLVPIAVIAVGLSLAAVIAMLVLGSSKPVAPSTAEPAPVNVAASVAAGGETAAPVAPETPATPSAELADEPLAAKPVAVPALDSAVYGAAQPAPAAEAASAPAGKADEKDEGLAEYQRQLKELAKLREKAKAPAEAGPGAAVAKGAAPAAPVEGTIRINCGPGSVPGWESGAKYMSGGQQFTFGRTPSTDGVENAAPAQVYRTCRHYDHTVNVNVPDGRYAVRLHFYDEHGHGRSMSYTIEGEKVLSGFAMPAHKASVKTFDVSVSDGNGMQIIARKDGGTDAFECGIEIIPRDGAAAAKPKAAASAPAAKPKPRVDPDDVAPGKVVKVAGDVIVNGSFETRDEGGRFASRWAIFQWGEEGARYSTRLDRTVSRSGEASVVVRNLSQEARGGFYQAVTVEPGVYELSFWACADIDGTAVVGSCIAEGMELSTSVGEQWKHVKNKITIKKAIRNGSLRLWTQTPMLRTWFDDVVFKRVGDLSGSN